jgi:cell division septum initiation protein DivIVA
MAPVRVMALDEPPRRVMPAVEAKRVGSVVDDRMDALEALIKKLDGFLAPATPVSSRAVIDDVSGLVRSAKTQQKTIDNLRRNLTDLRAKTSGNLAMNKQMDATKQEIEGLKRSAEALEKRIKDGGSRATALQSDIDAASGAATVRATKFIKDLLNSVFTGMTDKFVTGQSYGSAQVVDELRTLLRDSARKTLREISENGLL